MTVVVVLAAVSMAAHCFVYDTEKNRLKAMAGEASAERDDPEVIREQLRDANGTMYRFWLTLYLAYCRLQERFDRNEPVKRVSEAELRHHQRRLRQRSLAGPTSHLVCFALSALLSLRFGWGFDLYLLYSLGLANLLTLVLAHEPHGEPSRRSTI